MSSYAFDDFDSSFGALDAFLPSCSSSTSESNARFSVPVDPAQFEFYPNHQGVAAHAQTYPTPTLTDLDVNLYQQRYAPPHNDNARWHAYPAEYTNMMNMSMNIPTPPPPPQNNDYDFAYPTNTSYSAPATPRRLKPISSRRPAMAVVPDTPTKAKKDPEHSALGPMRTPRRNSTKPTTPYMKPNSKRRERPSSSSTLVIHAIPTSEIPAGYISLPVDTAVAEPAPPKDTGFFLPPLLFRCATSTSGPAGAAGISLAALSKVKAIDEKVLAEAGTALQGHDRMGLRKMFLRLAWPGHGAIEKRLDFAGATVGKVCTVAKAGLKQLMHSIDRGEDDAREGWESFSLRRKTDGKRRFSNDDILL
uniref:Uncharacterized protein n=1 Tax=Mycena chlorophos TaxID=658473 RepID=A0ABQ0LC58_MYCCL|nr:predicted protein [Mycena chlorophos]